MDNSTSSFGDRSSSNNKMATMIPHQGALCRIVEEDDNESTTSSAAMSSTVVYVIDVGLEDNDKTHELKFSAQDFDFVQKLFAILDTESKGTVDRDTVKEFVTLRCPVFNRRDDDLRRAASEAEDTASRDSQISNHKKNNSHILLNNNDPLKHESPTFDEVWQSVVESSKMPEMRLTNEDLMQVELGVESWMVFCRFVALAQYLEAKRRFSARHLQQTMRHRNSPRGSEVVVVDMPPPEAPAALSREQLAQYEQKSRTPLPLPELDLDHSLVAAHDSTRRRISSAVGSQPGRVKISLFGSSHATSYPMSSHSGSSSNVEFKLSYSKNPDDHCNENPTVVRRSMEDMKWLNDTFTSHNVLGGTLCGRILPPFPGSSGKNLPLHFQTEELLNTSIKNTTGGAIAAATAGVEIMKDVAKSIWNSSPGQPPTHQGIQKKKAPANKSKSKPSPSLRMTLPESYYNPNSPVGKARQVERYLNYLLEHPALSTSFPLNTILRASQSGLEAAKLSLEECLRLSKEVKDQTPQLVDGKTIIPFWGSTTGSQPSLSWVRTAAQAAMALKVHGMLETTGMQSASARLQHASLPSFSHPAGSNLDWVDEEQDDQAQSRTSGGDECLTAADRVNSFEQGVVTVQSELQGEIPTPNDDDGYDLLPLPIPAPERSILSVGSRAHVATSSVNSGGQAGAADRFHYGASSLRRRFPMDDEDDARSVFLGDISVDEHIDKLREVIGSVDNTLSRCLASSGGIGRARRDKLALHLDIVQGFDSWKGLKGKFIGQRPLLKGVSGIEQSNEVYEESDLALVDDVAWQTSLANSAVSAAEDVRSAVRAARTAENAKAAASTAAFTAQSACESGTFPSMEEARAAQTRASIAQSHAFHAAVVEHEAKAVKRRATLALAHDVKCWNVHRKQEMLQACISHARSQHEGTRRAVDAWSCLRDGFIGSPIMPTTQNRKAPVSGGHAVPLGSMKASRKSTKPKTKNTSGQAASSIINLDILGADPFTDLLDTPNLVGVASSFIPAPISGARETSTGADSAFSCIDSSEAAAAADESDNEVTATIYQDLDSTTSGRKAVIVAVDHNILTSQDHHQEPLSISAEAKTTISDLFDIKNDGGGTEILPFAEPITPLMVSAAPVEEITVFTSTANSSDEAELDNRDVVGVARNSSKSNSTGNIKSNSHSSNDDNEIMSASMQSLVDGLMSWGGQFEGEDVLALPTGMAASIAFEESDALPPPFHF